MQLTHLIVLAVLSDLVYAAGPSTSTASSNPENSDWPSAGDGLSDTPKSPGGTKISIRISLDFTDMGEIPTSHEPIQSDVWIAAQNDALAPRVFNDTYKSLSPPYNVTMVAGQDLTERAETLTIEIYETMQWRPEAVGSTYAGSMFFGPRDRAKSVHVVFNTGTHISWVVDPKAVNPVFTGHVPYEPPPEAKDKPHIPCHLPDLAGYVRGYMVIDSVFLGDQTLLTCPGVALCVANDMSPNYAFRDFRAHGALGLGPPLRLQPGEHAAIPEPILQLLGGSLEKQIMYFDLQWMAGRSELRFGTVGETLRLEDFKYVDVPQLPGRLPQWMIPILSFTLTVDGTDLPLTKHTPVYGSIESGFSHIGLPLDMAEELFSHISYKKRQERTIGDRKRVEWQVLCHSQQYITIRSENLSIRVFLKDVKVVAVYDAPIYCHCGIIGVPGLDRIVFGQIFMALYHMVFDFTPDQPLKIGFLKK